MLVPVIIPYMWELEAKRLTTVQGQPWLHNKFEASLGYMIHETFSHPWYFTYLFFDTLSHWVVQTGLLDLMPTLLPLTPQC